MQENEIDEEDDDDAEDEGGSTSQNDISASGVNSSPISVLNVDEPMLLLDMKYGSSQSVSAKSGPGN